jgi:hypothetical protein
VRVIKAEKDADEALKAKADGESTLQSLTQQVSDLQGGLQEMARLLKEYANPYTSPNMNRVVQIVWYV